MRSHLRISVFIGALAGAVAFGCGGASRSTDGPDDPSRRVTRALAEAVKMVRARRLDDAERLLGEHRALAANDPRLLEKLDYYIATVLIYRGELVSAGRLVQAHAVSAANRGDADSEAWMESSLTWLYWAAGDLDGAFVANERLASAATGGDMDPAERRAWALQQLWDRAFLLVERALMAPSGVAQREAVARASEARQDYETLADDPDGKGLAALSAWFAWRTGDLNGAIRALSRINVDEENDARDLYVIAIVSTHAGDRPRAERARARLGGMVNLLVPLLLRVRPPDAAPKVNDASVPSSGRSAYCGSVPGPARAASR